MVQMRRPQYSKFDLSHDKKMSLRMGRLVPMLNMECLPGDKFRINTETFLRFAPLISPVMHRVRCSIHFYFVPTRILWSNFERWITKQSDVEAPYMEVGQSQDILNIPVASLGDYMGLPTGEYLQTSEKLSTLPFAAYAKIWDEYYRDQNLQAEVFQSTGDGNDTGLYYALLAEAQPLRCAWEHDYFTSCLPFAQKGDAVQIPLTQTSEVDVTLSTGETQPMIWRNANGNAISANGTASQSSGPAPLTSSAHVGSTPAVLDPNGRLTVPIQNNATDINTLRRAFRLQEWLEKNARGGTRYIESVLAHFGIRSSDARLQRPEYLGGSKQNMVISEVLSTTFEAQSEQPLGALGGHGISVGNSGIINYKCEEHGFIIGVMSVKPDTAYYQGIHRSWQRFDPLDYAWPTFANIGEQEVLTKELFGTAAAGGNTVFGYIPRYAEYKTYPSSVAGDMRDTLEFWHMGRKFSAPPALNEDFISCNPTTRIFAVEDSDQLVCHLNHRIDAIRPLPKFGIPTI